MCALIKFTVNKCCIGYGEINFYIIIIIIINNWNTERLNLIAYNWTK